MCRKTRDLGVSTASTLAIARVTLARVEHIQSEQLDHVLILSLARGKANALNHALVTELHSAITAAAANESVRALVLASARPQFFSAGFDVREVFQYDRAGMEDFFGGFIDLYESLYNFPKPLVGALSGHTFAGGAILASACDFRIMAQGDFGFALNEINLGLALPPNVRRMLIAAVGVARAREILLFGDPLTPARALEIGLVREIAPPEQVRDRALQSAGQLAAKPPNAFRMIKESLRQFDSAATNDSDRIYLPQFLDVWFSAEAGNRRQAVAARM